MRSEAATIEAYFAELPEDRRAALAAVRGVILDNLPQGYEEVAPGESPWGMVTYQVPLEVYPDTYNRKPLMYAALAAQKQTLTVYLTSIYLDQARRARFEADYRATGKPYRAGKSCVHFRRLADLPLELVAAAIAEVPMQEFVARARQAGSVRGSRRATAAGDTSGEGGPNRG